MAGIIHCEVDGTPVLGFDTGLDAKAFAQTKTAQLITLPGWIVTPEGRIEQWKPEGVVEREGTMVIWGPDFAGKRLDLLIAEDPRKDAALDALRHWIRGRIRLEEALDADCIPGPYPVGACIDSLGTVLFAPDRLIKRAVESEGSDAWSTAGERWVHPDLSGTEASLFAAGTLAYRIFCGSPPFSSLDISLLRQDIREGVFFPLHLAAPGLDAALAALITGAIEPSTRKGSERSAPPALRTLGDYLGPPGSGSADSYFHSLSEAEQAKILAERERFRKKQGLTVKTKRFITRNTAVIAAVLAGIAAAGLTVNNTLKDRAALPTTRGMTPRKVAETYYEALGALDHGLMDACVIGKAGKEDINMVTGYFVVSKVRQAYEMNAPGIIPAQQWIDSGAAPTEAAVFGVSDFQLTALDEDEKDGEVSFKASYLFWMPGLDPDSAAVPETALPGEVRLPSSAPLTDTIRLVLHKDAWRIAEITRETPSR
ncbi:MAG: hypothetical protein LBD55_00630 [Treponema sp.]|jgi:hypothetical protein|nr:hypothetical protein [Treponema sp.]